MIYLHVGQAKSGTSILQNALYLASEQFGSFVYPEPFRRHSEGHHALSAAIKDDQAFAEAMPKLREVLEAARGANVVFSTEDFSNVIGPKHWARFTDFIDILREHDDVRIVMYQRRFDEFLNSMFLQSERYGQNRQTLEQYVNARIPGTSTWFEVLKRLRHDARFEFCYTPQGRGFDVLAHFSGYSDDFAAITTVGPLLKTEKFTLKQQVFISFCREICGAELSLAQMLLMIKRMRSEGIRLEGDLAAYRVIPDALCEQARQAALQAAKAFECSAYVDAFSDPSGPETPFVEYHPHLLKPQDIALMRDLAQI